MKLSKILYNKASARKMGWTPKWFGATKFDGYLVDRVEEFQRIHGLSIDGLVGPITFRRLFTNREAFPGAENRIMCNGTMIPINWDKIKIDLLREGCYKKQTKARDPNMVVTHWDACLSAASCKRILERRDISTHFVIDNDGTIVQLLDCNHIAWHAGNRRVNANSIGIDFSNAYYTKYQKTYVKNGLGERPVLEDSVVHGVKLKPHLGYYPAQILAYKALLEFLNKVYGIKLECPADSSGNLLTGVFQPAVKGVYEGVVCHYHLTRRKIDTAGLELDKIINEINENPNE
jgi:hypothetical protein|tara:strand:+ start:535 stop:1404 length:870 start_codon:yes stop_codon:yes gene_type:complete